MHNQSLPTAYFYIFTSQLTKVLAKVQPVVWQATEIIAPILSHRFFSECAAIGLQLLENPASLHWQPDEDVSTG